MIAAILGNLGSFIGIDGILILFVLAVPVTVVVALVRFLGVRSISGSPAALSEQRLQKLDALRGTGTITEAEYQEQRRRVLSEI